MKNKYIKKNCFFKNFIKKNKYFFHELFFLWWKFLFSLFALLKIMFIYVIFWNSVMVNFPVHNFEITLLLHNYNVAKKTQLIMAWHVSFNYSICFIIFSFANLKWKLIFIVYCFMIKWYWKNLWLLNKTLEF